ncbi:MULTISPECIES: hypothetical protein [unclassified Gordonia (in: high G+C Gram-positive bacteria)]|uniref:hypothetical protein n=1 Tax=unclassified Gordonia (in: high G+C Gram-positive bacteria) TaxID=2657482 RepID=UPI0009911F35|nr:MULTISPECIES: hypothetical protein [unclassified Gordonia (in: high G+C Gram-positive bacteria)]MCX2753635.1 hypothetical protein [Gordonia sp. 4N]
MAAPNDDASQRADDPHRETASIDIEDAGGASAPASLAVTLSMPMGGTLMRFLARVRDAEGEATGEVLRSAT